MKRPDVTLENCDAVYDFYGSYNADQRRARIAHALIGKVFKPDVTFLDSETEDLVRQAVEHVDVTILACKHVNMNDPLHLVALTGIVRTFGDLAGATVIPSKRPLFDLRIRRWIDDLGAIPTFRKKDLVRDDGTLDDASSVELSHATERLIDVCAKLMCRGKTLAIFPESERSAKIEGSDPSRVNRLKDGVARMYLKSIDSVTIAIVPLGLCYDETKSMTAKRKPSMVVGNPLTKRYSDAAALMADLAEAMQAAQTAAFERQTAQRVANTEGP